MKTTYRQDTLLDRLARYPVVQRTPDWLVLEWPAGRRAQTIQITRVSSWLVVTADVCRDGDAPARAALELAATVPVGSVIIHQGILSIRHVFMSGIVTEPEQDRVIRVLHGSAIRLRARLFARQVIAASRLYDE
jgi:hypothetical protein